MPQIELQHAGYRQNGVDILCDVNWRLGEREHWAVLGPNGSGKTTLLRVACGYEWPTSGRVLRGGNELSDLPAIRRAMGWVGEELIARVPHEQTALQIVASGAVGQLGLRLIGQVDPTPDDYDRARELLWQSGCDEIHDRAFGILSQGERQKVLVARARMTNPTLLVLDEPCVGMDPGARERFLGWLQTQLTAPQTPAVLLVTHHVEEIMPGFERTAVMSDGRIKATGPTGEVLNERVLAEVYGVGVEQLVASQGRVWPVWGS
jgi:iron complex transport system ATP-binding protein